MGDNSLQIEGLVEFAGWVREQLSAERDVRSRTLLFEQVAAALARIEGACRRNGCAPSRLAAPLADAYRFLKGLDGQPPQLSVRELRLPGLAAGLESQLNRLAEARSPETVELFLEESDRLLEQLHGALQRSGRDSAALQLKQQRRLVRLELYRESPWLERIPLNAIQLEGAFDALLPGIPFRLRFKPNDRQLWRVRNAVGTAEIEVSDLFLLASGPEPCDMLAELIASHMTLRRGRLSRRLAGFDRSLREWLHAGEPRLFKQAVEERICHSAELGRGEVYDLYEIFRRINRRYFGGRLMPAGIYWTPRNGRRRTGYYNPLTNEVFISAALDHSDVPPFVLDFIMYHELLHVEQHMQGKLARGKRAHTAAFRRAEQAFPDFQKADRWLSRFARLQER